MGACEKLCTEPPVGASHVRFALDMRRAIAIIIGAGLAVSACGKSGENAGAEEVRKQAEAEQKAKEASGGVAKKISPPVPGRAILPCDQVIDAAMFTQALGETTPVTVATKKDPDAAASCSIMRGGKRPNEAEQKALLKKNGRLGVMNGDEICNVTTFCWTIEDADRFRKKCADDKEKDDESLGFYSCVLVVATGVDDVKRFRFFDEDTKCLIQVRGGPSNVDNDLIGKCAKAAHDLIGPAQIAVKPAGSAPAAATGSGSGS
jgi:hypothetical protein